jgi:hypothetical protein
MRLLCDVILVEFDSCMADPSTTESYGIFTSSADYLAKIPLSAHFSYSAIVSGFYLYLVISTSYKTYVSKKRT